MACSLRNIAEAYSLRRFWGVSWHRSNLATSEAYLPSAVVFLLGYRPGLSHEYMKTNEQREIHLALRAMWVLFFSALFHAACSRAQVGTANLGAEMRFFLTNFAVCYVETLAGMVSRRCHGSAAKKSPPSFKRRILGHLWVYSIFFVIIPAWPWSLAWVRGGQAVV